MVEVTGSADGWRAVRYAGVMRYPDGGGLTPAPGADRVPAALQRCPSRYLATRTGQPRRPPHPPEAGSRGAHLRVLHRRLTTRRCNGKTQVTTPIIFPSLTGRR